MCVPLMVCLSMRDNGSMASAKRRGASGHPCPTPRSLLNGSDTDCDPMTRSVKPSAVEPKPKEWKTLSEQELSTKREQNEGFFVRKKDFCEQKQAHRG